jgi:Na+/melibiose symporter-like transporter
MKENHDYESFIQGEEKSAPDQLKQNIFNKIENDLKVTPALTWVKFSAIHAFIGALSLLFCPQFNLSLSGKKDLYYFFHQTLGHEGCMIVCGAIFLGTGALASVFLLKQAEIYMVRRSLMMAFLLLAIISLGLFYIFGAQIYFDLATPWLLGAVVGGASTFKVSGILKEALA